MKRLRTIATPRYCKISYDEETGTIQCEETGRECPKETNIGSFDEGCLVD